MCFKTFVFVGFAHSEETIIGVGFEHDFGSNLIQCVNDI